eukprot:COSAG05_NODE_5110_length_1260_cov_9.438415_1_plen_233_part_10
MDLGKCPAKIDRALGGDSAVTRFDKTCDGKPDGEVCAEGLTRQDCFTLCAANNFDFAGLEASRCCYCGNVVESGPQTKPADRKDCDKFKCAGNGSETCGGSYRVLIFKKDCGSQWGLWFSVVLLFALGGYFVVGTAYMHHKHGLIGEKALPNLAFWQALAGLVMDGVTFAKFTLSPGASGAGNSAPLIVGVTLSTEEKKAMAKQAKAFGKLEAAWKAEQQQPTVRNTRTPLME